MRVILIRIKGFMLQRFSTSYPVVPASGFSRPRRTVAARLVQPSALQALHAVDRVTFGRAALASDTYQPQVPIGVHGLPPSHMYCETFDPESKGWNSPGVARVVSVKSLDPSTQDPTRAYASEVIVDLRGTRMFGKTTPGEHLSMLDISDPSIFTPDFIQRLTTQGAAYQFTPQDFENLGKARLKNFTIASPMGGERKRYPCLPHQIAVKWEHLLEVLMARIGGHSGLKPRISAQDMAPPVSDWDAFGKLTGHVRLIVRRVECEQEVNGKRVMVKGPMTNFLVSRKPGDPLVFAAPIGHHFMGPKAGTPAIFFGVGTSVTPYEAMLRTRFEQEDGPYADTYLAIGHTRKALEYDRKLFKKFASKASNHFSYRPVYSRESQKSDGKKHLQDLIQDKVEARKIFALVLNPKAHIYVSGFWGLEDQLIAALKKSARTNADLGVTEARMTAAIQLAKAEGRWHMEGEVRKDLSEGLQGY